MMKAIPHAASTSPANRLGLWLLALLMLSQRAVWGSDVVSAGKLGCVAGLAVMIIGAQALGQTAATPNINVDGVGVTISGDRFSDAISFISPGKNDSDVSYVVVSEFKRGSPRSTISIQGVIDYDSGVNFDYEMAKASGGKPLNVSFLRQEVSGCSRTCHFAQRFIIELSQSDLASLPKTGTLGVKFFGTHSASDNPVIEVPVEYVRAVIKASTTSQK